MSEEKKSLWTKLTENASAAIDALKTPFVRKSIERKFASAIDNSDLEIINLTNSIYDELKL
jgi:hypothetical protein